MRIGVIVAVIVFLIALGLFGFLVLLDRNADIGSLELPERKPEIVESGLVVSSEEVPQGGTFAFAVVGVNDNVKAFFENKEVPLTRTDKGFVGVLGISLNSPPREADLRATAENDLVFEKKILVVEKDYGTSRLTLPPSATQAGRTTGTLVSGIVGDDNKKLTDAMRQSEAVAYFTESFVIPTLEWVNVGRFGVLRQSGGTAIRHLGIDLDAKVGDPIFATNRGKVTLSEYLTNYGHSIVIDHGLGIWSIYIHLETRSVEKGEIVERGQQIGEAGSTGLYSFEPHLHFSIRHHASSLDPEAFIEAMNKVL
jgi:murein DD-endopeptidase MepM/ murein hydrolase activator NlpD